MIVAGKLRKAYDFWKDVLKASQFILSVVMYGYTLPFVQHCPPFAAKNNASSLRNYDFVTGAIDELLEAKCIIETDTVPYCCNPLTVADGKKQRLVLDLWHGT